MLRMLSQTPVCFYLTRCKYCNLYVPTYYFFSLAVNVYSLLPLRGQKKLTCEPTDIFLLLSISTDHKTNQSPKLSRTLGLWIPVSICHLWTSCL